MISVAIVSITRSHLLNLAIALDKKDDVEVVFYTLTPKKRLREFGYNGKVVCFYILSIMFFITHKMHLSFKKRLKMGHKLRKWFDFCCSYVIKSNNVLIGENGDAYYTSIKSKKKFNSIIICDQGSEHINTQDNFYKIQNVYINPWNTDNLLKHYEVADYLMVPSDYVRRTDIVNGIKEEKILYNPYGVNTELFKVTDNPKIGSYDVIMVGNWTVRKGCDLLLKACKQIKVTLLHIGALPTGSFPDEPNFVHIDPVSEKELPNYYAKAKVFVLPSRNEGFGLVLAQAAACGLPIVYSSGTGGPEINKLLGYPPACFEINNPLSANSVAEALTKAIHFAQKLPEGPRIIYGDTIKNISWDAYGDRYYSILKKITNH